MTCGWQPESRASLRHFYATIIKLGTFSQSLLSSSIMAEKRKHEGDERSHTQNSIRKKAKKGFTVGPANLPDGTYKRKNQQIKESLIQRAQIKKEYAKLQRQGKIPEADRSLPTPASAHLDQKDDGDFAGFSDKEDDAPAPTNTPHPDRQNLMDNEPEPEVPAATTARPQRRERVRKQKPKPFQREYEQALKRKEEAEERRRAREEAGKERQRKIEERERFRKAMAKARQGGMNGQRKLGKESNVLLDKVKRMVSEG